MAKYYIESYEKKEVNFLASLNQMNHSTGNMPKEPYIITLRRVGFWGTKIVKRDVNLPRGFNYRKELTKGREFIF